MSLRTRTDRLLEEVGIERTATLNGDVRALAEAVGLGFTSLPATLTALEAEVLGAQAPPPAQPAEPAAAPAPAEPAADSDSDGFELTGSQTEAERTAAARDGGAAICMLSCRHCPACACALLSTAPAPAARC